MSTAPRTTASASPVGWSIDADRVRATMRAIAPFVRRTPMIPTPWDGFVKLESLQLTGSFKVRGFFAAALEIDAARRAEGLLTVSAGNAALACAYVARRLEVPSRVLMVDTAPALKVSGVRALGAEVVSMPRGALNDWIAQRAWEREPEAFIHPFAAEAVMTGHATVALEILEDLPDIESVFVPVGGGGLVCGIGATLVALRPGVRVVGVQSDGYPLWQKAFEAGGPVSLSPNTIADGTTAPFDQGMFERLRTCVGEWVIVPEPELRSTVARLATGAKVVAEGAGALGVAAMVAAGACGTSVAVVSGGNIDPVRLAELLV